MIRRILGVGAALGALALIAGLGPGVTGALAIDMSAVSAPETPGGATQCVAAGLPGSSTAPSRRRHLAEAPTAPSRTTADGSVMISDTVTNCSGKILKGIGASLEIRLPPKTLGAPASP